MKTQRKWILRLACVLLIALAPAGAYGAQSVAEVLARSRAAVGYERLRSRANGVVAEGAVRYRGLDSKFTLLFTHDGRFRSGIEGPLGRVNGFNGAAGWEVDGSGMPRTLELQDLEVAQFHAWIHSGRWLAEGGPFNISLDPAKTDDKQVALRLALKTGLLEATVFIERSTWLPKKATRRAAIGEEVFELGDYREVQGFRFPHRFTRLAGGVTDTFEIRSVIAAPAASGALFQPVTARPADTRWNSAVPARVEMRRVRSGHLLVRPIVNGREAGWFVLDSGAGAMVIDPKVADRLGMPALGETIAIGASGSMRARYRQGETFTLGPATLTNTRYLEIDLGFLTESFGLPIDGICGWDFFARAVVEIDVAKESVGVHDPSRFRLEGAAWQELLFSSRHPVVRGRFEGDREGLFKLDTGSDGTVTIHAPTVERFKLLSGRETRESRSRGVGGGHTSRAGKLTWFELSGHRFEELEVVFSNASVGAFSDIYTSGNIGMGLLRSFRIIFDYSQRRVAFVPLRGNMRPQASSGERVRKKSI